MLKKIDKNSVRKAKHARIRFNLNGSAERPRLSVYRSTTHIYAQVIDDKTGKTLCSCSTMDKDVREKMAGRTKSEQANLVGELVAKKCLAKKIKQVVFDRSGYIYTGRVKQVAEGARSAGLEF